MWLWHNASKKTWTLIKEKTFISWSSQCFVRMQNFDALWERKKRVQVTFNGFVFNLTAHCCSHVFVFFMLLFFFFMSLLILPKAEFCNVDAPQDEGLVCRQDVKIHELQYVRHMLQFMIFFYDFFFFCVLMAVCFCKVVNSENCWFGCWLSPIKLLTAI